jgi:hypothetical protein
LDLIDGRALTDGSGEVSTELRGVSDIAGVCEPEARQSDCTGCCKSLLALALVEGRVLTDGVRERSIEAGGVLADCTSGC